MSGAEPLWPAPDERAWDVVGLGQVCLDRIHRVATLPPPGGKVRALETAALPGGQVATALLGCARLGLRTRFLGGVGDDAEGEAALAPLAAAGVDTRHVQRRSGVPTQGASIWVEEASGERAIVWQRDPRLALAADEVPHDCVAGARVLHLDAGDGAAALRGAEIAREAGVACVLDADALEPGIEDLLARVDFPVVSAALAETVSGTSGLSDALAHLVEHGARMAVVTLGPRGALARVGERVIPCPPYSVAPRDTTGAGDAFRAGLIWGLLEGRDAEGVLEAASAVAALNCRALGAQQGLPDRGELEAFLARETRAVWREPT